jgi:methyl-accepting chemotaxis protein
MDQATLNRPDVNEAADSFMAVATCNLEAYRDLSHVTLESTERLEKIGIGLARNVIDKSVAAAAHAGDAEAAQSNAPSVEDWMRAQREIGDTLVNASQELARAMADYSNRLSETLRSSRVQVPVLPWGFSPLAFNADVFLNFWNQTLERAGGAARTATEAVQEQARHAQQVGQHVGQQAAESVRPKGKGER